MMKTSDGGTAARSKKPPIFCAGHLQRSANAYGRSRRPTRSAIQSLLRDRLIDRDRVALETYRDARAALALIREAVEDCAPPGTVTREDYLTPEFTAEAEALVR